MNNKHESSQAPMTARHDASIMIDNPDSVDCPREGAKNYPRDEDRSHAVRRRLLLQLEHDFIARRRSGFLESGMKLPTECKKQSESNCEELWRGVSSWERTMVSFCEKPSSCYGSPAVKGALNEDVAVKFVGFMAIHCQDVPSRALALAILERSLIADGKGTSAEVVDSNMGTNSNVTDAAHSEDPLVPKQNPTPIQGRVRKVLGAGGLKLLHQWLAEAVTPIKAKPTTSSELGGGKNSGAVKADRPSLSSALLLPLLRFLSVIPFDMRMIKDSKTDQLVHKLRQKIKKLADDGAKDSFWKERCYLLVGEATIDTVKEALDQIKSNWKAAHERMVSENSLLERESIDDPFDDIIVLLKERKAILENVSNQNKPEWLVRLREKEIKVDQKRKRKRLSTAELEKLERAKERSAMLREDLEKAQEYKRQCQARLRELEKKKDENNKQGVAIHSSRSKNRVRWKDGRNSLTGGRNRSLLEQVFIIEGRKKRDLEQPSDDNVEE